MINKIIRTKKILIFVIIVACFFLSTIIFILKEKWDLPYNNEIDQKSKKPDNIWITHKNEKYGYSFEYPASLNFGKHCAGYPEGIVFSENNAAVHNLRDSISVLVYNTNFASTKEWLAEENNKWEKYDKVRILEKYITIDGNQALVTYLENQKIVNDPYGEPYEKSKGHSKKTVFIKNGKLFEINTRFVDYKFTKEEGMIGPIWNGRVTDHEHVWNSFKINDSNFKGQGLPSQANISGGWKSYINQEYNYSVAYPEFASISDYCVGYPNKINFSDPNLDDYGIMSVSVFKNTVFSNINEWLDTENKKREKSRKELEKIILINGYEAIVTHQISIGPSQDEHFPYEKKTVFIKDNSLFEIWTRFMEDADHQKVWESFKFL